MLPGNTSNAQVMVDPNSNVAEQLTISCTMNEDFTDPTTCVVECFPGISCLHPLTLALNDYLRVVRNNKKDQLVLHYDVALPVRVHASLHTQENRIADYDTKCGKRMQISVVSFPKFWTPTLKIRMK